MRQLVSIWMVGTVALSACVVVALRRSRPASSSAHVVVDLVVGLRRRSSQKNGTDHKSELTYDRRADLKKHICRLDAESTWGISPVGTQMAARKELCQWRGWFDLLNWEPREIREPSSCTLDCRFGDHLAEGRISVAVRECDSDSSPRTNVRNEGWTKTCYANAS